MPLQNSSRRIHPPAVDSLAPPSEIVILQEGLKLASNFVATERISGRGVAGHDADWDAWYLGVCEHEEPGPELVRDAPAAQQRHCGRCVN